MQKSLYPNGRALVSKWKPLYPNGSPCIQMEALYPNAARGFHLDIPRYSNVRAHFGIESMIITKWKKTENPNKHWASQPKSYNPNLVSRLGLFGGGSGGIRTHGPVTRRFTRFRVGAVMTTSIRFHANCIIANAGGACQPELCKSGFTRALLTFHAPNAIIPSTSKAQGETAPAGASSESRPQAERRQARRRAALPSAPRRKWRGGDAPLSAHEGAFPFRERQSGWYRERHLFVLESEGCIIFWKRER